MKKNKIFKICLLVFLFFALTTFFAYSSQIFEKFFSSTSADSNPEEIVVIVDTDSTKNPDYTTLKAAIEGESGGSPKKVTGTDLVANNERLTIICRNSDGGTDAGGPFTISNWTTDADHYINIYVDEEYKHDGTFKDNNGNYTGYTLKSTTNWSTVVIISNNDVIFDGFIIDQNASSGYNAINIGAYLRCRIQNNILVRTNGSRNNALQYYYVTSVPSEQQTELINNLIFSDGGKWSVGIRNDRADAYNNTIYGCTTGFNRGWYPAIWKNNIVVGNDTDWDVDTGLSGTGWNISSDNTAPGSNSITNALIKDSNNTLTAIEKASNNWVIFEDISTMSTANFGLKSVDDAGELNNAINAGDNGQNAPNKNICS
jgi:hypothetical protein